MEQLPKRKILKSARSGKLDVIKRLADDKGSNLDSTTPQGNTVLHITARFGYADVIKEIIQRQPNLVTRRNRRNETPVHIAAGAGHATAVDLLLECAKGLAGEEVTRFRDNSGNTPLHCAIKNSHIRVVYTLARQDTDSLSLALANNSGETPLSIAIDLHLTPVAYHIIEKNPSTLEYRGPEGQTPLHCAVIKQNSEIIRLILDKKRGLLKELDNKDRSPLHYTAALGYNKLVKWLLEEDDSVAYQEDRNQQLPVHLAAENGHGSVLRALLDSCPDTMESLDIKRRNILHLAAQYGSMDTVSSILELPEMEDLVNAHDIEGNTPLHLAAMNFHSGAVRILTRKCRVEIRATNNSNQTALAIALSISDGGMEIQKHLTIKALKAAYAKHALNPEEILDNLHFRVVRSNENTGRGSKSEEMARTLTLMATVIATFTFTAAFTIPGGFKNDGLDEGMATLVSKSAFKAFIVTDTLAMTSSMTAAVLVFWSSACRDNELLMDTLPFAIGLTWISLLSMALAFVTGLFVVLVKCQWLAILVCVIGCAPPAILYIFAPTFLYVFDHLFSSRTLQNRRYDVVENNPFTFVFKLAKLIS